MSNATKSAKPSEKLSSDRDKLVADLKLLMEDAKVLTTDATDASKDFASEKAELVREQLVELLEKLKAEGEHAKVKAKEKTGEVEKLIQDNPWQSVGIALAVGFLLDRLIRD